MNRKTFLRILLVLWVLWFLETREIAVSIEIHQVPEPVQIDTVRQDTKENFLIYM